MLYIYCTTVGLAALVFAVFCRAVLLSLGFVPNFESGLLLIFSTGFLYVLIQSTFMSVIRLYQPTRYPATYLTEIASNASVIVLVPYILHVEIPWPSSVLLRVEPLIYLGLVGIIQAITKLATFYASHRGILTSRTGALGYVITAILSLTISILMANQWVGSLEDARAMAPATSEPTALKNGVHASVRPMPEGSTLIQEVDSEIGQTITTRWTVDPDSELDRIYATFLLKGKDVKTYQQSIDVRPGVLSEIRVPNEFVPENFRSFEFRWTRDSEPNWQRMLGLRPIVYALPDRPGEVVPAPLSVLMSGPFVHQERPSARGANVILIVVDGLAANHVSMMGYPREVTPALDKLAYGGLSYPNGYSHSDDSASAIESMLTGLSELALRSGQVHESIVPRLKDAGYSTIAFTEGEHPSDEDFRFGKGLEQGFEWFDEGYVSDEGSRATLERAQRWIGDHQWVKFFMMVRIRDLENYREFDPGEGGFMEEGRRRDVDAYDNALLDLDSKLGSLLKSVRDNETRKNTYVIVASPYGYTFALDQSGRQQDERTLRTPIIINGPGMRKAKIPKKVDIDDIATTISSITGVRFDSGRTGTALN